MVRASCAAEASAKCRSWPSTRLAWTPGENDGVGMNVWCATSGTAGRRSDRVRGSDWENGGGGMMCRPPLLRSWRCWQSVSGQSRASPGRRLGAWLGRMAGRGQTEPAILRSLGRIVRLTAGDQLARANCLRNGSGKASLDRPQLSADGRFVVSWGRKSISPPLNRVQPRPSRPGLFPA